MQNRETKKTESGRSQKSIVPYAITAIVLSILVIAVGWIFYRSYNTVHTTSAQIGAQTFNLEVADTDAARIKGLSERDALAKNAGMLFVFDELGDWRMHMIQMRFAIDIAWLDENKQVITIKRNATPAEYPEVYKASRASKYVVEVPEGTFNRLGVKEGDSISFSL